MTQRQLQFVNAYIETGNASEAYRRAYPRSLKWKATAVEQAASHLLKTSKVSARVDELRKKAEDAAVATRREVLETLTRIVRAGTPAKYLRDDGSVNMDALKSAGAELEAVEVTDTPLGKKVKFKLRDVIAAADRLAKLEGWDEPEKRDLTSGGQPLKPGVAVIQVLGPDGEG